VQIEHITRVGLSSRRPSQQKGHLSVGDSLLGKIVVYDKSMFAVVSEEFSDGASGVRSQKLKRGSFGSSSSNNDGVSKGVVGFKGVDQVSNSRSLLTDSDVDAEQLFLSISRVEVGLLVDDSVDSNSGLSSLSVPNDELSLSSTDGDETVNSLKTGLHRLTHRFSRNNTRSLDFDSFSFAGLDGSMTVDGVSQSIKDTTQHFLSNGHIDDGTSSSYGVSLLNLSG